MFHFYRKIIWSLVILSGNLTYFLKMVCYSDLPIKNDDFWQFFVCLKEGSAYILWFWMGGSLAPTNLRICGHWQMAEICPVMTTNSQGYPHLVVVYTTYLWWFRGWFIVVLTTLLLKLLTLEPPYFTSLRNGSSWCRYLSEPSAAFWISSAAKHQYFRSQ